jgi:hypothetical protein
MDMNIYELIRSQRTYMPSEKISKFMYQLLRAVEHMHKYLEKQKKHLLDSYKFNKYQIFFT